MEQPGIMVVAKKSGKKKKQKNNVNLPPNSVSYNGPTRMPKAMLDNDVFTEEINNAGTITSAVGGLVNTVFDWYAQASTPSAWTNLAALYSEFRILSMELELVPWNTYNTSTATVLTPLYTIVDRTGNSAVGSTIAAVSDTSCQIHLPSKRVRRIIKMNSIGEAQFTATSSPPATADRGYIKLYATGGTASINLYDFVTRIMVQFRGRRS